MRAENVVATSQNRKLILISKGTGNLVWDVGTARNRKSLPDFGKKKVMVFGERNERMDVCITIHASQVR